MPNSHGVSNEHQDWIRAEARHWLEQHPDAAART